MHSFITIDELYKLFVQCQQKICTDTRKIVQGSIFFSLKGGNFNANSFALTAIEQGCAYAVVDEEQFVVNSQTLLVKDCLKALQDLANHHRRQCNIPFLAITGSNGKTTNKELTNAVLSKKYKTLATIGNLNNHIGVPLTLLSITKEHEFAIIEMGANHQGEIDELCRIAEPDFGMITNIGKAHLEGFGGIEGVKKGKSEMYRYIRSHNGKIFINGDDEVLNSLAADNDKFTYGCNKLYDVIGKDVSKGETVSLKFTTRYGDKNWENLKAIDTQIVGSYNFINCLAAAAIGVYFKVDESSIAEALSEYLPNMNRSELQKTERNTILLDAYNANPNSMKAAIDNFAGYKADKKVLLLGDMFELGVYSAEEHEKVVGLLKQKGFKDVILVGSEFCKTNHEGFKCFMTTEECKEHLKKVRIDGSIVLIKGSRGMKMETLKEVL